MNCPDCKVEMDSAFGVELWRCSKCGKQFDQEDIERNAEE